VCADGHAALTFTLIGAVREMIGTLADAIDALKLNAEG
jgi:hypothetical protein